MEVKELCVGERAGTSRVVGVVKLQYGVYAFGGLGQRQTIKETETGGD